MKLDKYALLEVAKFWLFVISALFFVFVLDYLSTHVSSWFGTVAIILMVFVGISYRIYCEYEGYESYKKKVK